MAYRQNKLRKVKYKKVAFKLTEKQKDIVDRCSRINNTTPNKLIKTAIRDYLEKYTDLLEQDNYVCENQLSLFSFDNTGDQLIMFSEKVEEVE